MNLKHWRYWRIFRWTWPRNDARRYGAKGDGERDDTTALQHDFDQQAEITHAPDCPQRAGGICCCRSQYKVVITNNRIGDEGVSSRPPMLDSFVRNCLLIVRKPGDALFEAHDDEHGEAGSLAYRARLDGYAIIPREVYEGLLPKSGPTAPPTLPLST